MTFIEEIVTEVSGGPTDPGPVATGEPIRLDQIDRADLEQLVERITELVLRRLAERWRE